MGGTSSGTLPPQDRGDATMSASAWIGAIVGAVVGAAVWGGIGYATGYEVAFVAWGIGGLVGGLAGQCGSRGAAAGVACAVLALASIFLGKVFAVHLIFEKELGEISTQMGEELGPDVYDAYREDVQLFASVESNDELRRFMVERLYSEAESPEAVTSQELEDFETYNRPHLEQYGETYPDYPTWKREMQEFTVRALRGEASLHEAVFDSLNPFDLLFAVLGIGTAFKLGEGGFRQYTGTFDSGGIEEELRQRPSPPPGEQPGDGPPRPGEGVRPPPPDDRR